MESVLNKLLRHAPFSKWIKGLKKHSWLDMIGITSHQKWFIAIGTTLFLAFLLSPSIQFSLKEYKVGDVATTEVKSREDLLVLDEKSTQEKQTEAERSVLSVYDYDPTVLSDAEQRIRSFFQSLAASFQKGEKAPDPTGRRKALESSLTLSFNQREWEKLERDRLNPSIEEGALKLLTLILRKGVVNDKDFLDPDSDRGILFRNIQTREERRNFSSSTLFDLKEARTKLRSEAPQLLSPILDKETSAIALRIAEHFLKPNLTFNKSETEERKVKARETVNPVYFQIKRGEVILRDGDRIQERHLLKINALRRGQERSHIFVILFGLSCLTFLILGSLYQFSTQNIKKVDLSPKDLLFFCTSLIGLILFFKVFQRITDILGGEFFSIPSSSYLYLFPVAMGAMLVRIVLNSEVAIFFAILSSYFTAFLMGNQLFFFIFTLVGSIVGAHKVAQCEQRSVLLRAGLLVGGVNMLMILFYQLIAGAPFRMAILSDLTMGFLAGVLSSVLILGIAPIMEGFFHYTTDIKLLELANMDSPILKDLVLQAPGTYHHSIMVGSLAEAAAKSIGAHPLLARVSAYYHDIGKLKKPFYFIENAGGMENKHDHLSPSMSSLILTSHVKDGLELAQENRLGDRVTHIIQQHHGTSLISYFYQKAKEKENPEMETLDEKDFRYPGPKPQTKEAGIVMLADAVEAASRALSDPTPSRIQNRVQQIIQNIFLDGQLEDCELTLRDLRRIEENFSRILTAIFHQRIVYPSLPAPESTKKKNHENLGSKSAKTYPFRSKKNKKGGPTDIGRLGTS